MTHACHFGNMLSTQLLLSTRMPNVAEFCQQEKIHFSPEYFLVWTLITQLGQQQPRLSNHSSTLEALTVHAQHFMNDIVFTMYKSINIVSSMTDQCQLVFIQETDDMLLTRYCQHALVSRCCQATSCSCSSSMLGHLSLAAVIQSSSGDSCEPLRLNVYVASFCKDTSQHRRRVSSAVNVHLLHVTTMRFQLHVLFVLTGLHSGFVFQVGLKRTHTHTRLASCLLPQLAPLKVLLYSPAY